MNHQCLVLVTQFCLRKTFDKNRFLLFLTKKNILKYLIKQEMVKRRDSSFLAVLPPFLIVIIIMNLCIQIENLGSLLCRLLHQHMGSFKKRQHPPGPIPTPHPLNVKLLTSWWNKSFANRKWWTNYPQKVNTSKIHY